MIKLIATYAAIELALLFVFIVAAVQANALLMGAVLVLAAVSVELFYMEFRSR